MSKGETKVLSTDGMDAPAAYMCIPPRDDNDAPHDENRRDFAQYYVDGARVCRDVYLDAVATMQAGQATRLADLVEATARSRGLL